MYCLSFLKFHCLMSIHHGRSQKVSWAAKVLLYSVSQAAKGALYFEGIYCSVTPVSQPLSQHFLNYLTSVMSLLSQISLSHVSTWCQNPKSVLSRKGITLELNRSRARARGTFYSRLAARGSRLAARAANRTFIFLTPFSLLSQSYLKCLVSILYLLSQNSLHHHSQHQKLGNISSSGRLRHLRHLTR